MSLQNSANSKGILLKKIRQIGFRQIGFRQIVFRQTDYNPLRWHRSSALTWCHAGQCIRVNGTQQWSANKRKHSAITAGDRWNWKTFLATTTTTTKRHELCLPTKRVNWSNKTHRKVFDLKWSTNRRSTNTNRRLLCFYTLIENSVGSYTVYAHSPSPGIN